MWDHIWRYVLPFNEKCTLTSPQGLTLHKHQYGPCKVDFAPVDFIPLARVSKDFSVKCYIGKTSR